jgi:fructose-1,6-bisphosphatase/inositol monophosphatase family enzyme
MSIGQIRITGSIVYEMILVSKGVLQLSIFGAPHIWDIAAGIVIIKESGGEVFQWQGKSWEPLKKLLDQSSPDSSLNTTKPIMIGSKQIVRNMSSIIVVKLSLMKRLTYAIKSILSFR